jgi:hypothetical protein
MSKGKILTTLVAVSVLVLTSAVTPAAARWGGGWRGVGWRGAGIAAGIGAGLALGAAAAYGGYGYAYPSYGPYGYGFGYPSYSRYGYGYRYRQCYTSSAYC